MKRSIFADLKLRTHLLFRQTDDYFYDSNLTKHNLREKIYQELKRLGYKRILFYSDSRKIYFFDDESKRLTLDLINTAPKTKQNVSSITSGLLKGSLLQAPQEENETTNSGDDSLNLSRMHEAFAMRRIDAVMKDEKIRTAVIFENGDDFIKFAVLQTQSFVQTIANQLNEWKNLPTTNVNKVIFIFPPTIFRARANDTYANNILWDSYFHNILLSEDKAVFEIRNATLGETKNFLNRFRLYEKLNVQMVHFPEIVKSLHAYKYAQNLTYRQLEYDLRENIVRANGVLDINYCRRHFAYKREHDVFGELNKLIGLDSLKHEVKLLKSTYEQNKKIGKLRDDYTYVSRLSLKRPTSIENTYNLHYALVGNPGTGKTTTAKFMGRIMKALNYLPSGHLVEVRRDELVGQFVGETAIKTQQQIEKAMGGVLFIDEAYALYVPNSERDYGHEAINTLVANMTQYAGQFSLVIAGYKNEINNMIDNANPGFKRRFSKVIELEDYTEEELFKIYLKMAEEKKMRGDESFNAAIKLYITNIVRFKKSNFGNAGEIENLMKAIDQAWANSNGSIIKISGVNYKRLEKDSLPDIVRSQLIDEDEDVNALLDAEFANIVGQNHIKELVRKMFNALRYSNEQIAPGHYAFVGNPGTGKTTVAKLFGKFFKLIKLLPESDIVEITGKDLIGKAPGYTTKLIEQSIGKVIFIDEAYSLVPSSFENPYVINELVKVMEERRNEVCLIFAGYHREMETFIDSNSGFKSRIKLYEFSDYSLPELMTLLNIFLRDEKIEATPAFIEATEQIFAILIANHKIQEGNARILREYLNDANINRKSRVISQYTKPEFAPADAHLLAVSDIDKQYQQYLEKEINY